MHMIQGFIYTLLCQKFLMRSLFCDSVLRKHQNPLGIADRRKSVRDHKRGPVLRKLFEGLLNHFLTLIIQCRCRLIEDQNRRVL